MQLVVTSLPMHGDAGQLEMRVYHEDADQLSKLGSFSKQIDVFPERRNVFVRLEDDPRPPSRVKKQRSKV